MIRRCFTTDHRHLHLPAAALRRRTAVVPPKCVLDCVTLYRGVWWLVVLGLWELSFRFRTEKAKVSCVRLASMRKTILEAKFFFDPRLWVLSARMPLLPSRNLTQERESYQRVKDSHRVSSKVMEGLNNSLVWPSEELSSFRLRLWAKVIWISSFFRMLFLTSLILLALSTVRRSSLWRWSGSQLVPVLARRYLLVI